MSSRNNQTYITAINDSIAQTPRTKVRTGYLAKGPNSFEPEANDFYSLAR